MAAVSKIDSNVSGLRFTPEDSYKVVSGDEVWYQLEPNSYADFGGQVTTVPRAPITDSRQKKKGVSTDLDASGGYNTDLTQENLAQLAPGFFFAAMRDKDEITAVAVVDGTGEDFEPAAGGDSYVAGDLIYASGFDDAANNGRHQVSGVPSASSIPVTSDLVTAAGQSGTIRRVGFKFAAGDLDVDASGTLPQLTTTTKDLTTLGLIPGEWIYIGGDAAGSAFSNSVNNGFKRIRSVSANAIVLDKSESAMVTEASTTETMEMYFAPRIIKNESDPTLQVRTTYQIERTLGAPDDSLPSEIQSEYLVGAVPSVFQLNVATADKVTMDLSFLGADVEQRSGATGVKAGTRPSITESEAFNTSSDVSRIKLAQHSDTDEAATALFAFVQEFTLTVDNSLSPNKAVGTFGAFDVTAGMFSVSGSMTVYFADIAATQAVRDNADVTMDCHFVKANQGISIDVPLLTLGDGRPAVASDEPINLPITFDAASGAKVNSAYNHTLMMMFWDYLPNLAETVL